MIVSNHITISPNDYGYADVLQYARNNLVLPNPEYTKKKRMGFWLGGTPSTLSLYEVHGDKLVLPFGTLRDIVPMIDVNDITMDFPVTESINYHCEVPLYDYQREAVEEMYWSRYGILQSAAGSGKTQMGIALIAKLGKRALWLTHTKDLLTQHH